LSFTSIIKSGNDILLTFNTIIGEPSVRLKARHVGHIREIVRYPVKSMAGIATESALLAWHGLDGDRRFAFRRMGAGSGFPWLSASRLPELLHYDFSLN